jgi:dienelactone hydrolase
VVDGALQPQGREYQDLGKFSDWVDFAHRQRAASPPSGPVKLAPSRVRDILGFTNDRPAAAARVDGTWSGDGIDGQEVSWSVGYGPRTQAWLLRPTGAPGPLPGVLALHDHSNFKFFGKEKIADGPGAPGPSVADLRRDEYGGVAFANELARKGFTVLVHDVFLWGSRRFDLDVRPPGADEPTKIESYNKAAVNHEHVVAKYCTLLSTSLAGVVAYEDRVALEYLKSRHDVVNGRVGCIGLSGGGCRAALLQATAVDISVSVIVCMMSTYGQLLDAHVAPHTWMLFPPGLAEVGDWPDLAACRAPSPLVVQYARHDQLFPLAGMMAAHERLGESYEAAGAPEAYVGQFFDGQHCFDQTMQTAAFAELARWLGRDEVVAR